MVPERPPVSALLGLNRISQLYHQKKQKIHRFFNISEATHQYLHLFINVGNSNILITLLRKTRTWGKEGRHNFNIFVKMLLTPSSQWEIMEHLPSIYNYSGTTFLRSASTHLWAASWHNFPQVRVFRSRVISMFFIVKLRSSMRPQPGGHRGALRNHRNVVR